ncbi:MAG: 4Fe-4S binding protein [Chloroflexi bacterium]|nr:4Fe-4S binding protein [Chloroflexota bacterium]
MNANLLQNRTLRAFLISGLYPAVFQAITAAVFVLVIYQLLAGPETAHDNFGTALTWVLWWPLIPIIFVLVGRFWCAICPFGTLSDLVQKFVGKQRPVPAFLKKYGIWIIDALFIFITWADHIWGIVENPLGSGVLLLALTAGVVVSGAIFVRRTWCRYLCFLGGLSGNYARSGMLALRANQDICAICKARAACYNGNEKGPGCPMFEFPRQLDSNAQCNLCAACLKTCPNDAIAITLQPPTKELWFIRKPKFEEAFLAIVIMGIVFVQNVTMLEVWTSLLQALQQLTGTDNYMVNFTLTFLFAMVIPLALFGLAAWVARRFNHDSFTNNFAKFGYAIIPLDIAGHMAHNLFHLLAEGKAVVFTAQLMLGQPASTESAALLPTPTIQGLQYVLLGLGLIGSLYVVYAIGKHQYSLPKQLGTFTSYGVLIAVFLAINVGLFALPMSMRMHGSHSDGIGDSQAVSSHPHDSTQANADHPHDSTQTSADHPHDSTPSNTDHPHDGTEPADHPHNSTPSSADHSHDNSVGTHSDPAQWYDDPDPGPWPRKVKNMDVLFPPGEGRDLVLWNCMSCHTFVRIIAGHSAHSHGSEPGKDEHWDTHRIRHEPRLWRLSKPEIDTLYAYLKANFNDQKPQPQLPSWLKDVW